MYRASEGDVKQLYNRVYRFVKPLASEPGTWRLATPEAANLGLEGEGGGASAHVITGTDPIKTNTVAGSPTRTTISLDIGALTPRVKI